MRKISEIAEEIFKTWKPVSPAAMPYAQAMLSIETITDPYISEDGKSMVIGFLTNASTWRGEAARRIKAELNAML